MRIQGMIAVALAAAFLAGCPEQATTNSTQRLRASATPTSTADGRSGSVRSFAPLRDRGGLFDYDRIRVPRRAGAHTWHAIELSEAHALRSIATGMLLVTGPDGLPIRLRYERHVEHADGNWTWVGRDERGTSALVTFGEKAAFGAIPYHGTETLRVTTAQGRAWLVETDRRKLTASAAKQSVRKPDYLVPPRIAGAEGTAAIEAAGQIGGSTAMTPVVDLLLGYTPGFAAMYGGSSQAVTRLNYLVEITNQIYVNSLVDAQVRLVQSLQVNYPDNNSNEEALEQLTGTDGTAPDNVAIPSSLAPLRAARERSAADLVSLVRRFNHPENESCGVAWLIGGGQTEITGDYELFGYSVVSDTQGEQFPDGDHYCLDATLTHELGHNMGAQHDIETARGENGTLEPEEYGRFPYSFGFKLGNSFTVMAYGDQGQSFAWMFSNPDGMHCGSPCGAADADNARTLRQTMPIIASFRTPVLRPVRNDFEGDGKTDLFFHHAGFRQLLVYRVDGTISTAGLFGGVGAGYTVGATGDVNADGKADLVWTSAARDLYLWAGTRATFTSIRIGTYPSGWRLIGAGDIDGDRRSDLLFHNAATRQFSYRIMRGASVVRSALISGVGQGYTIAATGDVNADGKLDLIWTSAARDLYLWAGNGVGFTSIRIGTYPVGWVLVGAGDIDDDRRSDLVFHNQATGQLSYRIMRGASVVRASLIEGPAPADAYRIGTTGDFNADGKLDLMWIGAPHDLLLWTGDGSGFSPALVGYHPYNPQPWTMIR